MKRIVHLGLGNFHRAHQAWYTAKAGGWKITGVVMSNAALKTELSEHNNEFILGTWGSNGLTTERVSIYDQVLLASENSTAVIESIADPETHVITLTVTEKGYLLTSPENRIETHLPPISLDLGSAEPKTAIGLLAAGLLRRRQNQGQPLTVISCDNLANNGSKLSEAIFDYISVDEPEALSWISEHVAFPNSMIDRITPKLSANAHNEICAEAGVKTAPVVGTEAFTEWVIEDAFKAPRPNWENAGAVLVADVTSHEERKLRLLNAAHSYLAYAGLLAGYTFVHEAITDSDLRSNVNALWDEAAKTVSGPAAASLGSYRNALLERFSVVEMRHRLDQIATDGSLKLRERLLPVLLKRQSMGLESPMTLQAISTWVEFVQSCVANNQKLNDPNDEKISAIVRDNSQDASDRLISLITDKSV